MTKEEVINECKKYNNTLHNHTDVSLGDGVTTPQQLVDIAKEMGATAVGITDHGNCANWLDLYNAAKTANIKPVLGVEAYVLNPESGRYNHLIVAAKNYAGVQDISKFVSATNRNIQKRRVDEIPVATEDMFSLIATGNTIITSACIAGPIADSLMDHARINREIMKVQRKMDEVKLPDGYKEAAEFVKKINNEIASCNEQIKALRPKAKKRSFKKTENKINKMPECPEKAALIASLDKEKLEAELETRNALSKIDELQGVVKCLKSDKKLEDAKKVVKKAKDLTAKKTVHSEKIQELELKKLPIKTMMKQATRTAQKYKEKFGDDFYMEVQYHGISEEKPVYQMEVQIAKKLGIKLIAANDSHIPTKEHAEVRTMLRNARFITKTKVYKKAQTGDEELYIKNGKEIAEALVQILEPEDVLEAIKNAYVVTDSTNIVWSEKKHYPHFENAKEILREKTLAGIPERYPDGFPESYRKRMEYELKTIDEMGFNDYFCEVIDFIQYTKNSADNSIENGPGRGSGAGSIVCYLTKITEIDPMKYNLMFERFLNPERVSMPDIDTDFSKHARKIAITYVKNTYGEKSVAGIMTKSRMAAKASLDYAGKLWGLKKYLEKQKFVSLVKGMKGCLPDTPQVSLAKNKGTIEAAYSSNKDAMEILRRALLLEGLTTGFGTHAAGIIIGDGMPLENYIPLMVTTDDDGNNTMVIQADMVQAEAQLGFIKMDFLGLKNLNVITYCMRLITKNYGIKIDPYNLPIEKEVIEEIFQSGFLNFIFQFESGGMKKMVRDFKPTTFEDLILLVACYRPGPMQYLTDEGNSVNVIKVKNGITKAKYLFPELKPILESTYGGIIYQEQVIKICQELAGYSMAQADNVRRFMSKKKKEKLAQERKAFVYGDESRNISGCVNKLCKPDADDTEKEEIAKKADQLFTELEEFAKYAFNKAHATCYALVAYITAWLKYHYFREYVCAAMTEQDKPAQLAADCGIKNVAIYAPNINDSSEQFITYKKGIIYGLSNIKGLKSMASDIIAERENNGVYTSIEDFICRINPDADTLKSVCFSGAVDMFCNDRNALYEYAIKYKNAYNVLKEAERKAESLRNSTESKLAEARMDVADKRESLESLDCTYVSKESSSGKLAMEMEYLGMWVTGNPLDDYEVDSYETAETDEGFHTIAGIISDFVPLNRKKDGAPMGKFVLTDKDSEHIDAIAFTKAYKKVRNYISDGAAVAVTGKVEIDDEGRKQIVVLEIEKLQKKEDVILFTVKNFVEKAKLYALLKGYEDVNGLHIIIYNSLSNEKQGASFLVNEEILRRKNISAKIIKL